MNERNVRIVYGSARAMLRAMITNNGEDEEQDEKARMKSTGDDGDQIKGRRRIREGPRRDDHGLRVTVMVKVITVKHAYPTDCAHRRPSDVYMTGA